MARVEVAPGFTLQCYVDDYLWPWQTSTPVVMVHGFARNAGFWRRWIPKISSEHRVYRPELRGFGASDVPPDGFAFDAGGIVADLLVVLDHFRIERAHFVGESSGGVFSVVVALDHPERVASLVLCDTPVRGSTATTPQLREIYAMGEANAGQAMRKYGVGEWTRRTLEYRLDVERASPELQDWYVEEMGKTPAHMAAAINDLVRTTPSLGPMVDRLTMPVLLLGGDASKLSGTQLESLARELPNGKLRRFPGYGHGVNVLAPEACAAAALEFWRAIS